MKRKVLLFSIAFASCMTGLYAENGIDKDKESNRTEKTTGKNAPQKSRLTLGGYGEAVMTRNFYSDNINRYSKAVYLKDAIFHGQFYLSHVVILFVYDLG